MNGLVDPKIKPWGDTMKECTVLPLSLIVMPGLDPGIQKAVQWRIESAGAEQRMKIFFDVDGVLIDGWHADPKRRKPWDLDLKQDFGISPDAFRAAFFLPEPGREAPMQACVRGAEELENALARVLPRLGYDGPVEDFIAYWFEKDSNINEAVLETAKQLASLPDIELYIATGQEHRRARHLWQTLGFEKHFKEMFYSARLGHPKPAPEFFAAINDALGITPEEHPLFFDDTETIVALAREAGWDAHLFETVEDLREHPRVKPLLERPQYPSAGCQSEKRVP